MALGAKEANTLSTSLQRGASFDHLVGAGEKHWRHGKAECTRGLEVDDELEFGRLLDRQVSGLRTLEDAARIDAKLSIG